MFTKPIFSLPDEGAIRDFAQKRSFGVLAAHKGDRIFTSPLPFDLREDERGELFVAGHIARANEMIAAFVSGNAATITVMGPDAFVPAEWFGVRSRISTWIYGAVEISGTLEPTSHEVMIADVLEMMDRLQKNTVKDSNWTLDEINPDLKKKYLKYIAGFRLNDLTLKSCFRLNQQCPEHSLALAENLRNRNSDVTKELAAMVENPPTKSRGENLTGRVDYCEPASRKVQPISPDSGA